MYITALDFGSNQVKILVAEAKNDGRLLLMGAFKIPSAGVRKGEMTTFEEAVQTVERGIDLVKEIDKAAAKNIFINVSGVNVKLQNSRGIVAVSRADSEIYSEDIDRVVKASQAINLGPNRMILHTITREFIVDGIGDIIDPLGMIGNRLEVNTLIVDAFKPAFNNLIKAVEAVGGKIGGLIFNPLTSSQSVLTKAQKELGVIMIDIGFGTSSMAVYEENKLISANVFPVGSSNITNDLAIGLKCSIKTAEAMKISLGAAPVKDNFNKDKIELQQTDNNIKSTVSRRFVSEIIEIRLAEIFDFINNELKLIGKSGHLPAGAVLTGGGAKMAGITEMAKRQLKLPIQIAIPELPLAEFVSNEFEAQIEDPEFSVSAGLLLLGLDQANKETNWAGVQKGRLSKIFKYFIP